MRKTSFLIFIFVVASRMVLAAPADSVRQIHDLMSSLYKDGEFNGSILVASRGEIVYANAFGMANFKTAEKFAISTTSCVASVTKQFTAAGIMMLAEQK